VTEPPLRSKKSPAGAERPRRIVDAAAVGLAVIDKTGLVKYANPALLRLTGLLRSQIVKRSLPAVLADDIDGHLDRWLRDPHAACRVDFDFVDSDGDPVRLTGWINPLPPGVGDPADHAVLQLIPRNVSLDIARAASRFDAIADDLSDAVVITDTELRVLELNRAARHLLPEVRVGEQISAGVPSGHDDGLAGALRTGQRNALRFDLESQDGPRQVRGRELRDSVGQLVGHAFTFRAHNSAGDESADTRVLPARERVAAHDLLDEAEDVIWLLDDNGPIAASAGARALLGLTADEDVSAIQLEAILHHSSRNRLIEEGLAAIQVDDSWSAELRLLDAGGSHHPARVWLRHHDSTPPVWSVRARLASAAVPAGPLRDPSTGLPTEAVLSDRLEVSIDRALRHGRRTCLAAFAVDRHEELVPSIGKEMAERLVVAAAATLRDEVRPGDTIARTGPDTFEIIRDDVEDIRDAERFAERLRSCLDEPVTVDGVRWYLSLSCGVALTQPGVTTVAGLRRNGGAALDQARRIGGAHTVVFGRSLRDAGGLATGRTGPSRRATHGHGMRRSARSQTALEEPPPG